MLTLLIGMLLAFVLGALTAILPLWVSNPDLFKRTYQASVIATSNEIKQYPVADHPQRTPEEAQVEAYLSEMKNMLAYDGRKQDEKE